MSFVPTAFEQRLRLKWLVRSVGDKTEGITSRYIGLEHIESGTGHLWPDESATGVSGICFRQGDVLFGKLRPYLAKVASPTFAGVCTSEALVLRSTRGGFESRFLRYLCLSDAFIALVSASTYGAQMPRANWDFIGNLVVPHPALSVQKLIADFLDKKTAAIDALIAKKERLIELLQEKRQALITQAVTKGLDPSVPMKDSGVEWLGEIPAHWGVKRLRHISPRVGVGVVVNPSSYVSNEGVPFLFGADIGIGRLRADNCRRISDENSRLLRASRLHTNDVVTIRVGATRGWTAVIPPDFDGANCASIVITRGHHTFNSDWLCAALNSRIGQYQIERVEYGAAQPQFNVSHATEFWFAVPPFDEQRRISGLLRSLDDKTDRDIERLRKSVKVLIEYRQALITAAVTGQLDITQEGARDPETVVGEALEAAP